MKKKFFVGRPVNESWQAYREYIYAIARQTGVSTEGDDTTEDEWREGAARFWAAGNKDTKEDENEG